MICGAWGSLCRYWKNLERVFVTIETVHRVLSRKNKVTDPHGLLLVFEQCGADAVESAVISSFLSSELMS